MKWLCKIGIHKWQVLNSFSFCDRPTCLRVVYFPGTGYWDLDICDTRWVFEYIEVQ